MQDLNDLYYFAQVVEHGGFAAAERATGIPKSKLSRRISELEDRLSVRLLQRSTRHISVTEIGKLYYQHCQAMLLQADAAQEAIEQSRSEPCGLIRVSCPITLLHINISHIVNDYMRLNPQVRIELIATNRPVDLVEEGIDVALRVRPPPLEDSDLVLKVLAKHPQCIVASPKLLAQHFTPQRPQELPELPTLGLGIHHKEHLWHLYRDSGEEISIEHSPRFVTGDMTALREAAIAGIGVVQLPTLMIKEQLNSGELVHFLKDWAPKREIVHAVFPSRRGILPSVRSFLDYLSLRYQSVSKELE